MVMVYIKQLGKECYLDGYHKENLDGLKLKVAAKWDGCLLYTGREGDGKTTKAGQDLAYLDENFSLENVCFTLEQVKQCVERLPPGSGILYDESRKDVNASATKANLEEFIKIMTENRYKRFYWAIVTSTFFDLKKYFAIHRTAALINVYANGLERGFMSVYDYERKLLLYIRGKKDWNWHVIDPNYRSRFGDWVPWDEAAYDAKKKKYTSTDDNATPEWVDTREGKRYIDKRCTALYLFYQRNQAFKDKFSAHSATASFLDIKPRQFSVYINELRNAGQDSKGNDGGVPLMRATADGEIKSIFQEDQPGGLEIDKVEERGFERSDGNNEAA